MMNRDATAVYMKRFPDLKTYYDNKYGKGRWTAFRNRETGRFTIDPKATEVRYEELQIAETDKEGFVWLELTNEQAILCIVSGLFEVYARFDDESETLVETLEEYIELSEVGIPFYLEVGHIDPDFFKMQG
jgi:hypothetical protein